MGWRRHWHDTPSWRQGVDSNPSWREHAIANPIIQGKRRGTNEPESPIIPIHPAPYQDLTFAEVARRGNIQLLVRYLFEANDNQPYLSTGCSFHYDSEVIHEPKSRYPGSHDFGQIGELIAREGVDVVIICAYVHGTTRRAWLHCKRRGTPIVLAIDSE